MSRLALAYLGPPGPGAAAPPPGLIGEEVWLDRLRSAEELAAVLRRRPVLWVPAWARLEARHWTSILAWLEERRVATARVRLRMVGDGFAVPLGRALVLARPGASDLRAGRPVGLGGRTSLLGDVWDVVPPEQLSEHLRGANRQSSDAVRLSSDAGRPPWLLDLLRPLGLLPGTALRGRGAWRRSLPRVAIEGYRRTLLAAKSWERRHAAAPPAVS